jgi:hypothetical protein
MCLKKGAFVGGKNFDLTLKDPSKLTSHKSNPSSIPQSYVKICRSVPWVTWEVVTEQTHCGGLLWHMLAYGLWSTSTKVEGIVLKAAWHWGSYSSVIKDPLEEPGLWSAWGSGDSDCMFTPIMWENSLSGDSERYEWMNKPMALEMEHLSPYSPHWANLDGGSCTRDFEKKVRLCFIWRLYVLGTLEGI